MYTIDSCALEYVDLMVSGKPCNLNLYQIPNNGVPTMHVSFRKHLGQAQCSYSLIMA